jgi:hypothetical protein
VKERNWVLGLLRLNHSFINTHTYVYTHIYVYVIYIYVIFMCVYKFDKVNKTLAFINLINDNTSVVNSVLPTNKIFYDLL